MKVNLSGPDITQKEIDLVVEVLKSKYLSIGPKIQEFEQKVTEYFQVKHAIGVNSGTSGLHLLVKALGITEGDEVITTPFSFVASTNCFLFEKAKPVFVDIDENTMNIDINKIEEKITKKTKAILVVDVFGQPVNMEEVNKIANKNNLKVIEDSCEAIGSENKGIKAGTLGDCGVFAFYPNKQITTGEGGMILTNSDEIANLCRSLRSQGRAVTGTWLHHDRLGYNYRMNELQAALGVVQMERLDEIIEKRQRVANLYNEKLEGVTGVTVPYIDSETTRMSWFVYVVRLDSNIGRNSVLKYLTNNGIGCKPYFTPIHLQPYMKEMFGFKENDFPITERISNSTIALPFHNNLTIDEIDYVVKKLKEGIKLYKY
ncbi:DegT/DnrJ/EryC1/StrS family aminotransferase [Clostridium sp. D2Q-11]|uniref:DegT/DnrJ/EryC1/StrS family aminotransferase n=1 Tax=Anaeromonas frigoriresistens TaxID=2683708 RepID=A0A942Z6T7_9FIRM|nr:DegT/DnrJ/EryC1/StrS family aminotransferase [Anaeromonas frigoriresistens]MBS4538821.1 DegT/DnrJ/EryC1/StrS family aminotransferase [Anaeromonas frigoriresistens]